LKPSSIDLQALAVRESEQVEWKEDVADVEDVVRAIVAFSNDFSNLGGGYVVCGAGEETDEHGFQRMSRVGMTAPRCKEIEGKVLSAGRDHVEPSVVPLVQELPTDNPERRILVFVVPATPYAHQFRNKHGSRYYVRAGRSTIEARNGLLRELLVRKHALEPWDRRVNASATDTDIDVIVLREYLQRMGLWSSSHAVDDYLSPKHQLAPFVPPLCEKDSLSNVLRPRNFALLLFGREPTRFFPGAHAIFSTYPGRDRSEAHSERVMLDGSIAEQARKLVDLLNTEAYLAIDKTDLNAPNLLKYPQRALQEAVINAIVHRDYESDQPVRVTAFSDRVEINSPGTLPSAVDRDKFMKGQAFPVWRNQALAFFFNKLQLAQAEGQGIPTILRTMRDEGCPDPRFEVGTANVLCTLPAHPRHEIMRELKAIEREVLLGHFDEADRRAATMFARDPYDVRVIELLCETNHLRGTPERVADVVRSVGLDPERLGLAGQLVLGETLSSIKDHAPDEEIRSLTRRLLEAASTGRLHEAALRKLVVSLRKVGESERALTVLDYQFQTNPKLRKVASLLELHGKVLIDLAKRCSETARNPKASTRIKAEAWEQCRRYLELADRDLHQALQQLPSATEREFIANDLEFLNKLKNIARKPVHRKPYGRGTGHR